MLGFSALSKTERSPSWSSTVSAGRCSRCSSCSASRPAGYVLLEGYGWIDAAYIAIVTLSAVGYGEVHPLDTAGRIFTMGVIVASFGTFVYAATTLTNVFTSGEAVAYLRRSRGKRMRRDMDHHVIVVGFGWWVRRWLGGSGILHDPGL